MFFRKPGEDTSTSSDDSNEPSEDMNVSDANASQSDLDNILSRINTINSSTASLQIGSGRQTPLSGRPNISRSNSHVRDLVLHSLLEDKALRDAAEHLGKDVSDPEVQKLGSETYHALSRQMANSRIVDEMYASHDMRDHRARAQEGITAATRSHLAGLPASAVTGDSLALMRQNIAVPLSGVLDGISSPIRLLFQSYPGLRNDHYTRDFVELELVGKGGYGKVYKVQHKLDNALYAVKRITVSPARLRRMHENGPHEMEKVLEEVRALAKFDHENIVRYHSAWLEFTTGSAVPAPVARPTSSIFQGGRLIQDASVSTASFGTVGEFNVHLNDWSIGDRFGSRDQEYSGVFFGEDSDAGTGAEVSQGEVEKDSLNVPGRTSNPSKRRASQASHMTDATASSARTRKSTAESDHSEEDEDVETIPRSHHPHSQELTSDMTGSMMSDRYDNNSQDHS
jgi:translation initiation factor 2-alpha kinase 3